MRDSVAFQEKRQGIVTLVGKEALNSEGQKWLLALTEILAELMIVEEAAGCQSRQGIIGSI